MDNTLKFKFTTDNVARTEKPPKPEVGKISNDLHIVVETDISQFSKLMENGYTFSPAIFKNNTRSNANWIEQQILAFDFDNGVSPETIRKRLEAESIHPNIIYNTFSSKPEHLKFRVVLVLENPIKDRDLAKKMQLGMMSLLKDTDPACKDFARMYFGGNKSEIFNSTPISNSLVESVAMSALIASDSGRTRKLPKSGLKKNSYYNSIRVPSEANFPRNQKWSEKHLRSQVQLFDSFMGGEWLTHPEIFGLATSMYWLSGGLPLMRKTMEKFNAEGKTGYTENNFACLQYVNAMGYMPQDLASYSRYEDDAEHKNAVVAARDKRGTIEKMVDTPKISLSDAERRMRDEFNEVLMGDDTDIHILKLPTGIGKTRLLENFSFTIAEPTNKLKDEVYDRVVEKGVVSVRKTPETPILKDTDTQEKISYLYRVGLGKLAIKLITEISNSKGGYEEQDIQTCAEYLNDLRGAYGSKNCVVTTHNRAIFSEFKSDKVVFDEDPLNSILQIKHFNIADLINLEAKNREDLFVGTHISNLINYLRNAPSGVLTETPMMDLDIEKLVKESDDKILTDLVSVSNSDYIIRDSRDANIFHYISRNDLPENKKIIILSATVPTEIYKKLYGDRVKIVDISNVEQKGEIIQITKKSYSRTSLRNNTDSLLAMMNIDLPTITFKEFINKFPSSTKDMYFGNVEGYDRLKGSDINVVGTPHVNNIVYILIGAAAGIRMKPADLVMSYKKVEYGGFKFKFNCYDNLELMNIQLSIIESELIQAVGRNRTLREECKAFVYSNLPLSVSTKFEN